MSRERIVIVDGSRTPVGKYDGALKSLPAHELGAIAAAAAIQQSGIAKDDVDEVIMGCVGEVGRDAYNARRMALAAGLPDNTPAFNVNWLCGSGLQAIWSPSQQLGWAGSDVILAGGDESMSRMPFLEFNARGNARLGDRTLIDGTWACSQTRPVENTWESRLRMWLQGTGCLDRNRTSSALRASVGRALPNLKRPFPRKSPRFTCPGSVL